MNLENTLRQRAVIGFIGTNGADPSWTRRPALPLSPFDCCWTLFISRWRRAFRLAPFP